MARTHSPLSISILKFLDENPGAMLHEINKAHGSAKTLKSVYDTVFRLTKAGLIIPNHSRYMLTEDGHEVIHTKVLKKDGVWKIVIFDIAETDRYVRNFLRQRLKLLGFKKWQNSIWISPFEIDTVIEKELKDLTKQYFVRLIKTTDINITADLDKLFAIDSPRKN